MLLLNDDVETGRSTCCAFPIHYNGDMEAFQDECDDLARQKIAAFFRSKSYFLGGPIPARLLNSMASITPIVSVPFMDGMDLVYEVMEQRPIRVPSGYGYDPDEHGEIDIFLVLNLVAELRAIHTPVEYQSGLILLYLKLCRGLKLPKIEYDVSHLIR